MGGPLRNKQGCWTCRLRKKKCDEGRPHCSTCESLSITCYGYGPKPDWMDHAEKERAVANSLKQIVKHTSRRTMTSKFANKLRPIVRIAPKSSSGSVENSSSSPGSNRQYDLNPSSAHGSPPGTPGNGVDMLRYGSAEDSPSPEHYDHPMAGVILSISAHESVLLMHFLDNVFPLLYPMYKPGFLEGGRGWLLALVLRTKPLYHATLAVSAYHRRKMIILAKMRHMCAVAALVEQETHLGICLIEFQQILKSLDPSVHMGCPRMGLSLGLFALVVQLIFFELFNGQGNAWQMHFHAATNMFNRGYTDKSTVFGLAEKSRRILDENLRLAEDEPGDIEEVASFRFLSGTMIWLDITASITAGTAPHLLPYHQCAIASNSQTKLEDIMGCKNWVMLQIGRIAALHERKTQALHRGHFASSEFEQTVGDISRDIQCGLTQEALEGFSILESDSATAFNTKSDPRTLVTRIFAYMASIYLHVVTHDFQKLEVLDTTISEAMRMLQTQVPTHLLPSLVSSLYVIGSVARQGDEQFFRNIFSIPPLLDPFLEHRARILPILEEIWTRRQTTPSLTWKDTHDLTHSLLLL
ncbi:fungal-specific transcription factor domain-containing protein [Lipomyces kononenkoae]|uniref:Fungal-specific transcription factor domain-containing protein n=1 Tax=Lipomyces kononenkoae TaxID=34357 RepID=A0ACC3T311_LIPKO